MNRREFMSMGTAAAIAAAAPMSVLTTPASAESPTGEEHIVEIRELEFRPKELNVVPGDTVVWVNHDFIPHTITADDETWDSDHVDTKGEWRMVVDENTRETYYCRYHPSMTARLRLLRG